jgi:hypothetical protein
MFIHSFHAATLSSASNSVTEIGEDDRTQAMTLGLNAVRIIEGIRALDPRVLDIIGRERALPIYH